jgi:hypothetical protein
MSDNYVWQPEEVNPANLSSSAETSNQLEEFRLTCSCCMNFSSVQLFRTFQNQDLNSIVFLLPAGSDFGRMTSICGGLAHAGTIK